MCFEGNMRSNPTVHVRRRQNRLAENIEDDCASADEPANGEVVVNLWVTHAKAWEPDLIR